MAQPGGEALFASSPDGSVRAAFGLSADNRLYYFVTVNDQTVVGISRLGLLLESGNTGDQASLIELSEGREHLESYALHGKHSRGTDHHNRYRLTVSRTAAADQRCVIEIRIFDDAVAFRYIAPGFGDRTVSGEATTWNFPQGSLLWYQTDTLNYEGTYRADFIGSFAASIGPPLVVQLPDQMGYAVVTEASLHNYSGMTLAADNGGSTTIRSTFLDDSTWTIPGGTTSPWRVVLISDSLDGLVNSDVITSLNPRPLANDLPSEAATYWIRPGRSLWSWWSDLTSAGNLDIQKQYIDFAHQLGFEYILVDAGWETGFADGQRTALEALFELVQYGRSDGRNVGVWVWKDQGDLADATATGDFLYQVRAHGAVGVKFDFYDSESFATVQRMETTSSQAALTQLMLIYHGVSKPTGETRSFPNEMTREGVRGLEANLGQGGFISPEHNATLPFTRLLAGPADYTPVTFDPARMGATTFAHQLATAGLFTSPVTIWADNPQRYLDQTNALDIIKAIPATWDETRVLDISLIGKIAAMARRHGDDWFLFIINGDSAQELNLELLSLSFLGEGVFDAVILEDATATSFNRRDNLLVDAPTLLNARLLPGGGLVARFRKILPPPSTILDSDNDGVVDAEDSAPDDPALSSLHTFYNDADRDHYGNSLRPVQVNSIQPLPPLVAWGGDPNDLTATLYPLIPPKGDRVLGLDFTQPGDDERWRVDLARELGVEVAPLDLRWDELEAAPGSFTGPQVATLRSFASSYPAEGFGLSLSVNPIFGNQLALPSDLRVGLIDGTLRFNDPVVVDRFNQFLDFLHAELGSINLQALQIGYNVDFYLSINAQARFWTDYMEFFSAARAHARLLWGSALKVGITATHNGLIDEPARSLLLNLNQRTDFVSASLFPRTSDYSIHEPESIGPELENLIAAYPGREVQLVRIGYPSSPGTFSSTTKQSQFLKALFTFWDIHREAVSSLTFTALHDSPLPAQPDRADRYAASLGLRTRDGKAKPAYHTLRNLAFERGWWRIPNPDRRSFRLGFSEAAYDHGDNLEETIPIENWMQAHLFKESDIFNLQMDAGVPWTEALNDDFSTTYPPYHYTVLNYFWNHLLMIPRDHKLMVAISPVGTPRSQINAYWGEGEGYSFIEGNFGGPLFVRKPDGVIGTGTKRFPPDPWHSLPLDSPEVTTAFTKYAMRVIDYFSPYYLLIALEVSAALIEDRGRYEELVNFTRQVYQTLKSQAHYRHVPIVVSISSTSFMTDEYGVPFKLDEQQPGVRQEQIDGLRAILPYMDVLGLSHYPHYGKYHAFTIPASMYDSLFETLQEAGLGDKPIAITESGYTADTFAILEMFFNGTAEKQDLYFKHLFHEMEKVANPVEYIINWQIRDHDYAWQRQYDEAIQLQDPALKILAEFNQYFRDIGIYDGDGNETRPSLQRWRNTLALPVVSKALTAAYPYYLDWVLGRFPGIATFDADNEAAIWGPQVDADGDRLSNYLEYFHNTDPLDASTTAGLTTRMQETGPVLQFPVNRNVAGANFLLQTSRSPQGPWAPAGALPAITAEDSVNGTVTYSLPLTAPDPADKATYFRLVVDVVP